MCHAVAGAERQKQKTPRARKRKQKTIDEGFLRSVCVGAIGENDEGTTMGGTPSFVYSPLLHTVQGCELSHSSRGAIIFQRSISRQLTTGDIIPH